MKSASPVRPEARLSSFLASVAPPFGSVFGFRSRTSTSRFFFSSDSGWLFSLGIIYDLRLRTPRVSRVDMINQHENSSRHDEAGKVIEMDEHAGGLKDWYARAESLGALL